MQKLFIFLLPFLIFVSNLDAETIKADLNNSDVSFVFQSPIITSSGNFTDFSGTLGLNKEDNSIKSLVMNIDVSKFRLNNQSTTNVLALTALANSLPSSLFKFVSTSVSRTEDGRLKIAGILSGSGKRKPATFYAKQKELNSKKIGFKANIFSKDFEIDWPKEIAAFGKEYISGRLDFNLIF